MDGFAIPLIVFTALLVLLLVEIIRGSFEDPIPRRAGVVWAITCPVSGMLFGIGLAPIAIIVGVVSLLALGSLGWWFLATEPDDSEGDADESFDPDPGPSDDMQIEIPDWAQRAEYAWEKPKSEIDWDAFDRARTDWEREFTPKPATPEPERVPQRELVPAGV